MQLPKFTLVLGGAASGKSSFAEKLVIQSGLNRSYLATAQAFDDEMREKIKEHQRDRGENWDTTEVPIELPKAVFGSTERQYYPCGLPHTLAHKPYVIRCRLRHGGTGVF